MTGVAALVPARAGSRRIAHKCRQQVGGRTLVQWAIDVAASVPAIGSIVLSTDDPVLLADPGRPGVELLARDAALASDEAPTDAVVRDAVHRLDGLDVVVVLQPTSPFRAGADVIACLDHFGALGGTAPVATVTAIDHPIEWAFELDGDRLVPWSGWEGLPKRAQDCPRRLRLNGAVYVTSRQLVEQGVPLVGPSTRAVEMPPERSLDIDTPHDLALARWWATTGDGGGEPS